MQRPYRTLASLIILFVLSFLILEGWLYSVKPTEADRETIYRTSVENAVSLFTDTQLRLLEESRRVSNQLRNRLQAERSLQELHQTVQQFDSFWGVTLFRGTEPQIWSGFSFSAYPDQIPAGPEPFIDIRRQNNVTLMLCRIAFSIEDSTGTVPYNLIATQRIEQSNALPIGSEHEFRLLDQASVELEYPVMLSFFEALPTSILHHEVLSTISKDSVGIAYAPVGRFESTTAQWITKAWYWRSVFCVLASVVLCFFFYRWFEQFSGWNALLSQLAIICAGWIFFNLLSIPEQWFVGPTEGIDPSNLLTALVRKSVFVLLISLTISRHLKNRREQVSKSNFLRTLFSGCFFGIASVIAILAGINYIYFFLLETDIRLFDLQIFPGANTLILYLGTGLLLYSIGYGLTSIGSYLLQLEQGRNKLVLMVSASTFAIGLLIAQLYLPEALTLNWAFTLSMAMFGVIAGIVFLHQKFRDFFASFSLLRITALCSLLVALFGLPILKNAYFDRTDTLLLEQAEDFITEEDRTARNITEQILVTLENELEGITQEDLAQRVPQLQSQFTRRIEQIITPEWRTYSLNLQLIRPSGTLIADYSTDLNAPNWTNVFDLTYLSAATDIERITRSTNRPIIQLPSLGDSERYETFYRGWIPIFSTENNNQIAWILCSVYREHPDFDKPVRAVLASLTYTDWEDSYQMLEYENGELIRSNKQGILGSFPIYNRLSRREIRAMEQDSLIRFTSFENQRTYRNLMLRTSENRIVKISTIYPDLKNLMFSFFRFSFTLLLLGLITLPIIYALTHKKLLFWGSSKRFEHRILDSFLLAMLLFLGILITITHYTIEKQNEEIVRQELFEKLEDLSMATQNNERFKISLESDSTSFTLEDLTSPLNVDAAYYEGRLLAESTTPQIYQQHLLPLSLPFEVYNDLYIRQSMESSTNVSLASQNLLIGFHVLLSEQNEPIGAIAIPTFVQSPKYDRQLLETISYLIVLYLIIFGIFVLATAFISKQLTRPLRSFHEGLNRISKGELNTTLTVNSNDEIGSLADAYNKMVQRLKEVRNELAVAEREAAWKEMAQQVAHEIKNPLTPMKLNVQHLKRQLAGNSQSVAELKSKVHKITQNLIDQIQTLNNIASDFSKFSKPIAGEFTKTDVNSILDSVVDLYQHDDKIEVTSKLTEYPIYVKGVHDELMRVFINLVKNAFEAMPEEGGTIVLKSSIKQGGAFFEIEDDGTGISEENKSRIFVPNFSTKSSGTGLGLAICKKIVEAHEGTITFASIEGHGTTFIIKLPIFKQGS